MPTFGESGAYTWALVSLTLLLVLLTAMLLIR